jgi:surface protein
LNYIFEYKNEEFTELREYNENVAYISQEEGVYPDAKRDGDISLIHTNNSANSIIADKPYGDIVFPETIDKSTVTEGTYTYNNVIQENESTVVEELGQKITITITAENVVATCEWYGKGLYADQVPGLMASAGSRFLPVEYNFNMETNKYERVQDTKWYFGDGEQFDMTILGHITLLPLTISTDSWNDAFAILHDGTYTLHGVYVHINGNYVYAPYGFNTEPEYVLEGKKFYNYGSKVGTMKNNGKLNYTPSNEEQIIPAGYTSGGKINGDSNLVPENIKSGVAIFGIEGSANTLKQFSSIEEMNASTGNNKDDIAIANTNVTTGIELDTPYNALTFPKTTILPSVLKSNFWGYGHDDGWTYDIQVSASTTQDGGFSAKVEYNNWSTNTQTTITYNSVDGITFIANEISEDTTVVFDTPVIFLASENGSSWSEILGYFVISESSTSQDIYQYNGASWTKLGKDANDWSSELRSCNGMFEGNAAMTEAPYFDTSNVKTMYNMFNDCSSLTTVPLYNTSKVTAMNYAFRNCTSLVSIPQFDVSRVTDMQNVFNGCTVLENVPALDTSSAKYLNGLFLNCISLKTAPELNTGSATSVASLFNNCEILETVPLYDCSNADNIYFIFHGCENLTNLGGLSNLGKSYTQASNDHLNYTLDLSDCVNLTHDSLMNVINNLYDLNLTYDVANGGTLYTQKLNLGATNIAKLTAEEIAIATNKGWNVV